MLIDFISSVNSYNGFTDFIFPISPKFRYASDELNSIFKFSELPINFVQKYLNEYYYSNPNIISWSINKISISSKRCIVVPGSNSVFVDMKLLYKSIFEEYLSNNENILLELLCYHWNNNPQLELQTIIDISEKFKSKSKLTVVVPNKSWIRFPNDFFGDFLKNYNLSKKEPNDFVNEYQTSKYKLTEAKKNLLKFILSWPKY